MSWITIVWSMNAAACLTLAGIYLLVWWKQRENWEHLVFSFTAVAGAALTAFELALLRAQTTAQYGELLRWVQLPVWVLVVSLVVFVRLYLRAGRPWLAWSVCGVRTLVVILNFIFTPNLSYRQITSLRQVVWWGGETVSVPVGVTNPWVLVAQLSLLLLVMFFVDATNTAWRRSRQRALVVGGALILFSAIAVGQVVLVVWGIIQTPYLACFAFLGLIAAMGYQMSSEMLQRTQLARQLEANEADLREANKRMELAASAAELGMWTWDIVRDEIWITDKGRALFGLAPSEKVDFDRFRNMLHPEDRESVLQLLENSLRTGAEYTSEYRAVLPNGQIRWIAGGGQVEFDADGQPVRMRGCSLDITKRRRAEEQLRIGEATLRESKERIDLATKAAGLVVWTWDIPRDEVWLSNKDRALFGFSQGEKLTAERIRSVVHPEDRQLVRQLSEDALITDEEIETQYRVLLPGGRVRWVTRRGRVEFDADGKPFRERGVLMDITKLKQAELEAARHRDELSKTQERMELAASAAGLGMWMWDVVLDEIWVTDKGRALFGLAPSDTFHFDRFRNMLHPEDRETVLKALENSLRTGAEYTSEYRALLPDGQLRWIAGRGQVEFDAEGQPVRMFGCSLDITRRKQAELEAACHRDELVHLSRVTTLGELSGSIAHELTQPLSAILSNAQAAQRVLASGDTNLAEQRHILDDIVSEDKRAIEVIRRLRLWLKKGEVQQHSLRINKVVRDVLNLIRSDLINQKVILECKLARDLPTVTGDPVQLQQVLLNLMVNACDAMTECNTRERRLLIRTRIENGRSTVIVSVTDRGGSIPEDKMEQVFEPFFTTKAKGMGLGLSVCRTIIAAHRGKLWATNNVDRGATFHFSLPIDGSEITNN